MQSHNSSQFGGDGKPKAVGGSESKQAEIGKNVFVPRSTSCPCQPSEQPTGDSTRGRVLRGRIISSVFATRKRVFLWSPLLLAAVVVACTCISVVATLPPQHATPIGSSQDGTQRTGGDSGRNRPLERLGLTPTIKQCKELLSKSVRELGDTGWLVVADADENYLYSTDSSVALASIEAVVAEPMRRAVEGQSGDMTVRDAQGNELIAAFACIPGLNWGIVATVDQSEIRSPFLKTSTLLAFIMLVVVIVGGIAIVRLGKPLIQQLEAEIVEHKRVEETLTKAREELETSERLKTDVIEKLNEAQEVAGIGSWDWNLKTNVVWWSAETYRLFGVSPRQYTPSFESNAKFIHPDDLDSYRTAFSSSLETGNHWIST